MEAWLDSLGGEYVVRYTGGLARIANCVDDLRDLDDAGEKV